MPNGGPDNCFNCIHIEANHGAQPQSLSELNDYMQRSRCLLRQLDVPKPHWTYCASFTLDAAEREVKGPVWAGGGYDHGYVRITWHDEQQPRIAVPASCCICGCEPTRGIEIDTVDGSLGFCCSRHYVEWWLGQHEDENVTAEGLSTPEELFGD